jgi:Mlc titration factor MtfA (ptsG expression regulator)
MALIVALQACLPILKLGLDCYRNWYTIVLYPAGFATQRVVIDENGVEHIQRERLSGEAWQQGPVILSWDDALEGGVIDGHNLVIHEFAHKLDMQNGVANGFPPLHKDMARDAWVRAFSAGFEDFQNRCEQGQYIGIDYYAATSAAEFFAVLSEVFFERPEVIYKHYPEIYTCMKQYYRQDTLWRLGKNHIY